jgi:anti-sigma factor RsiW
MTHVEQQADALLDLVDGRLGGVAATALREHIDSCPECRGALAELEAGRGAATALGAGRPAPADLGAAATRAPDQADRRKAVVDPPTPRRLMVWRAAIALAAVIVLLIFWLQPASEPVRIAAQDARSATTSDELLEIRTTDPAELDRALNTPGRPRVRVIDLGMMGYSIVGGRRHVLAGRPSVLYVYRDKDGARLVSQMFVGRLAELRFTPDVRQRGDLTFRVYADGELTLVFWQEGDLVCVLAGRLPREAVVELAIAKAMAPSR